MDHLMVLGILFVLCACSATSAIKCDKGQFDPGNGTCMPCSGYCQGVKNCTCPRRCMNGGHGCSQRCPKGCPNTCDKMSGLCTQGCQVGKWYLNCSLACSKGCENRTCNMTTGACTKDKCRKGWYGGARCDKKCSRNCKGRTCNKTTGNCTDGCKKGFYGEKCETPCNEHCDKCKRKTGKCIKCQTGYYGHSCQNCSEQCVGGECHHNGSCTQGCRDGYRGALCNATCPDNCEVCDRDNDTCARCQTGYYGHSCQNCSEQCVGGECHHNGSCTQGCQDGYHGESCNATCSEGCQKCSGDGAVCLLCQTGFYNNSAQSSCDRCPQNCRNRTCNQDTGECKEGCLSGHWGSLCDRKCPSHCKHDRCNTSTGLCTEGCDDGFMGEECNVTCPTGCENCTQDGGVCPECLEGYYKTGDNCTRCPQNCNGTCDADSGRCPQCVTGYFGPQCRLTCPKSCRPSPQNSRPRCLMENGSCTDGCLRGKHGHFCNLTCSANCRNSECEGQGVYPNCSSGCVDGFKGDYCQEPCPSSCTRCSRTHCQACTWAGWWGDKCQTKCGNGCPGNCSLDTGRCEEDCEDGWKGDGCNETCADHCWNCSRDGLCGHCSDGWFGKNCTKPCPNCLGEKCSKADGFCEDGCENGFFGDRCDHRCSWRCLPVPIGETRCNERDGACPQGCMKGWMGENCTQECWNGTYGPNCQFMCGKCYGGHSMCGKQDGECGAGCLEGFVGKTCQLAASEEMSIMARVSIAVASLLVLILLVTGLIIYFLFVKPRRRRMSGKAKETYQLVSRDDSRNGSSRSSASSSSLTRNGASKKNGLAANGTGVAGTSDIYTNAGEARAAAAGVAVSDLHLYVANAKSSGKLTADFESLPKGLIGAHHIADLPKNKSKNRYRNICAYDSSRVPLDPDPNNPDYGDYINACYISGYKNPKKYIAVQGPVPPMVADFWRMLWQLDVGKVVMLTNLVEESKVKCMQYWPNPGSEAEQHGPITIRNREEVVLADFTVRTLEMKMGSSAVKVVTQFHFTSWPDRGVPHDLTTLLEFSNKVRWSHSSAQGPLVVHCSAGIGRTGTYIALNTLLEEAKGEGAVNVYSCVLNMRHQRVNMVQTEEQYVFLHEVLSLALLSVDMTVPASDFPQYYAHIQQPDSSNNLALASQFQLLQELAESTNPADYADAMAPENATKNRRPDILASDRYRPYLTCVGRKGDYINAVSLPTYLLRKGLILTQAPLSNTIEDVYRLVTSHSCRAIVILNDSRTNPSGVYWPDVGASLEFDTCTVTTTGKEEVASGEIFSIDVLEKERGIIWPLKLYKCGVWPDSMSLPPSPHPLLDLLEETELRTSRDPVLVHCMDGCEKSGLFCVLQAVLERVKMEQEVAIFQTVYQLRLYRPQLITSLEQYRFVHDCIQAYLDANAVYTNFSTIRTHQAAVSAAATSPCTPLLSDVGTASC